MSLSLIDPDILFEDEHIIVVYKPGGLASESAEVTRPDMVRVLKNYLNSAGEDVYLGLLHRLDQPVEGIMVFAKSRKAASVLSEDIRNGRFKKEYLAACHPGMGGTYLMIDAVNSNADVSITLKDHLIRGSGNMVSVVPEGTNGAKEALLTYTPLRERYTLKGGKAEIRLIRVRLLTGRHHQIRVQLSHTGLPIVGDRKYGCMPDDYRGPLMLSASGLTFIHPVTHESMHFEKKPKYIEALNLVDNPV